MFSITSSIVLPKERHTYDLNYKDSYLTPFLDFSPNHLMYSSTQEAAKFAVEYAAKSILISTSIEKMEKFFSCVEISKIDNIILEMREHTNDLSTYDTLNKVYDLTDKAMRFQIRNCEELCAIAARALMSFGYQGQVMLFGINRDLDDGTNLNHCFLGIVDSKKEEKWLADPLIELMTPEQRRKFLLDENAISVFPDEKAGEHLYLYLRKDDQRNFVKLEEFRKQNFSIDFLRYFSMENIDGKVKLF